MVPSVPAHFSEYLAPFVFLFVILYLSLSLSCLILYPIFSHHPFILRLSLFFLLHFFILSYFFKSLIFFVCHFLTLLLSDSLSPFTCLFGISFLSVLSDYLQNMLSFIFYHVRSIYFLFLEFFKRLLVVVEFSLFFLSFYIALEFFFTFHFSLLSFFLSSCLSFYFFFLFSFFLFFFFLSVCFSFFLSFFLSSCLSFFLFFFFSVSLSFFVFLFLFFLFFFLSFFLCFSNVLIKVKKRFMASRPEKEPATF